MLNDEEKTKDEGRKTKTLSPCHLVTLSLVTCHSSLCLLVSSSPVSEVGGRWSVVVGARHASPVQRSVVGGRRGEACLAHTAVVGGRWSLKEPQVMDRTRRHQPHIQIGQRDRDEAAPGEKPVALVQQADSLPDAVARLSSV